MIEIEKLTKQAIAAANRASAIGTVDALIELCTSPIAIPKPPSPWKSKLFPNRPINVKYLVAAGSLTEGWKK